jgi:hypothetical protein
VAGLRSDSDGSLSADSDMRLLVLPIPRLSSTRKNVLPVRGVNRTLDNTCEIFGQNSSSIPAVGTFFLRLDPRDSLVARVCSRFSSPGHADTDVLRGQ